MFTDVWSGNPDTDRAWRDGVAPDPLEGNITDAEHEMLRKMIGAFPIKSIRYVPTNEKAGASK